MKAVILGISPNATIVDVSHQVEKFDVRMGAYVLASAVSLFSKRTLSTWWLCIEALEREGSP